MADLHGIIGAGNALNSFAAGYYGTKLKMLEMDQTEERWRKTFDLQKKTQLMNKAVVDREFKFKQEQYLDGADLRNLQVKNEQLDWNIKQSGVMAREVDKLSLQKGGVELFEALDSLDFAGDEPHKAAALGDRALSDILLRYPGLAADSRKYLETMLDHRKNNPMAIAHRTVKQVVTRQNGPYSEMVILMNDGTTRALGGGKGFGEGSKGKAMSTAAATQFKDMSTRYQTGVKEVRANFLNAFKAVADKSAMGVAVNENRFSKFTIEHQKMIKGQNQAIINYTNDFIARESKLMKLQKYSDEDVDFVTQAFTGGITSLVPKDAPAMQIPQRVAKIQGMAQDMIADTYTELDAYRTIWADIWEGLEGDEAKQSLEALEMAIEQRGYTMEMMDPNYDWGHEPLLPEGLVTRGAEAIAKAPDTLLNLIGRAPGAIGEALYLKDLEEVWKKSQRSDPLLDAGAKAESWSKEQLYGKGGVPPTSRITGKQKGKYTMGNVKREWDEKAAKGVW